MNGEECGRRIDRSTQTLVEGDTERDSAPDLEIIGLGIHHRDSEVDSAFDNEIPRLTRVRTLKEYAALVGGKCCRWCGAQLKRWIEHYDHNGGWEVSGFSQKQWLYATCPRCKYQWNLGKLGIAR
jgi:hypothetical protein